METQTCTQTDINTLTQFKTVQECLANAQAVM